MLGAAELISDILLWTPTHGHTSVDQPTKANIHQLFADTGYHLEDIPRVMDSMRESRESMLSALLHDNSPSCDSTTKTTKR